MTTRAAMMAAVVWLWATSAHGQYVPGEFSYQLYDQTGTVDLNGTTQVANMFQSGTINPNPTGNSWFVFRVYLVQNPGPGPSINTVGLAGVGARINYANVSGTGQPVFKVPTATAANIISGQTVNPYDLVVRNGSGTTLDTTYSAAITMGLFQTTDIVPLPGDNGDSGRFLIATFKMQGQGLGGQVNVEAVDPFGGTNIQTGPNPPGPSGTIGDPAGGPLINIDPYLSENATPPSFASFTLVPIPEPGTLALCLLATAGLAVRCRRHRAATTQ